MKVVENLMQDMLVYLYCVDFHFVFVRAVMNVMVCKRPFCVFKVEKWTWMLWNEMQCIEIFTCGGDEAGRADHDLPHVGGPQFELGGPHVQSAGNRG